jgi:hypothetical protein
MNPVYSFAIYLCNIILPSPPGSQNGIISSEFQTKMLYAFLVSPMLATFPTHLILLHLISQIVLGEDNDLYM